MNLVKENIRHYLPALLELIDFVDFPWNKIDKLFTKKLEERALESDHKMMLIEASVYDIIVAVKKGNRNAVGLLDFLNKLFEELTDTLTKHEKILMRKNARSMLTEFGSKYLNFVGEMAVLNNIVKSGEYRLKGIEDKLANGKGVDFTLIKVDTNEIVLVEIVNIHLDTNRVKDDPIAIRKFLTNRLESKMADEKKELIEDLTIFLVPVLWGGWKEIKIYSEFYKKNRLDLLNILEPLAYLQYSDGLNYYVHHFKSVSHLFDVAM